MQLHRIEGEVGMAVLKSTQTRIVEIITHMVHPYACSLVMVHVYWYMCSNTLQGISYVVCPLHISQPC